MRKFRFQNLFAHGKQRVNAVDTPIVKLPPVDIDLEPFLDRPLTEEFTETYFVGEIEQRYWKNLQDFLGLPQICFLNYICIVALRRKAIPPEQAINLLTRLWREHPQALKNHLSIRWLTATLQALALCEQLDESERMICYSAITFVSLIKLYEGERFVMGIDCDAPYPKQKANPKHELGGFGGFSLRWQNIGRNMHADLYQICSHCDFTGVIFQEIMERMAGMHNAMTRLDVERQLRAEGRVFPNLESF